MKRFAVWTKLLLAALVLQAFVTLVSVFEQLGLEEATAKKYVLNNVLGNYSDNKTMNFTPNDFDLPRAKLLSSVVSGDKAGAAKELCAWLKEYTKSPEFAQAYSQRREALKPASTVNSLRPDDETVEMTRESLKSTEKELASLKKNKNVPAASIAALESQASQQREMLKLWDDPDPALTRWQTLYPAEPQALVRQRLQSYLDILATVDFDAQLASADKYGIRKFVKPEYEKKDNRWKAIYRAGREVNGMVKTYVESWIKELSPQTAQPAAAKSKPAPAAKPVTANQPARRKQ
ncbi:MAG TPA: hypothetical protein VFR58_07585 [Flavisolibacter sp.]|nr:hypothetical protein [Flavisolibacter sp.]